MGRTMCRSNGVPAGYAVVDYIVSSDCPRSSKQSYNAMVLVEESIRPVGSIMRICLGTRRPTGWDPTPGDPGETTQCPREPGDKEMGPTVVEIVRVR